MSRLLALVLRLGLGLLFVVAGLLKLGSPGSFATEIANYRLLPEASAYLAATLPAVEVLVGALLLFGTAPWRQAAALVTAGLMAVFTVAVTTVLWRGINIDCGCFGGHSGPVTGLTLLRDLLLLGAALFVFARATLPTFGGADYFAGEE